MSSFDQTIIGWSSQYYIPSFVEVGTPVLKKKIFEKVQVGKDQEKAQSERDSHSKNRGGKNQTNNQALIP